MGEGGKYHNLDNHGYNSECETAGQPGEILIQLLAKEGVENGEYHNGHTESKVEDGYCGSIYTQNV